MANDYTTSTDAFADISEGGYSSSDYPVMDNLVKVASRLIDAEVGRGEGFFYPSTDAATYYYSGSGLTEQEIDEFVSIASVSVSETGSLSSSDYLDWTPDTDYVTEPYNATNKGKPITKLSITQFNSAKGAWYGYQRAIKIVGVAGYSATPPDLIVQATKIQAVRWFMRAKQGWQDVGGTEELGKRFYKGATELDADVKLMLFPFKLELDR